MFMQEYDKQQAKLDKQGRKTAQAQQQQQPGAQAKLDLVHTKNKHWSILFFYFVIWAATSFTGVFKGRLRESPQSTDARHAPALWEQSGLLRPVPSGCH